MQRLKATLMMVAVELLVASFSISYKLAAENGIHLRVLITYRYLFSSILIFPVALFLERNKRPKLTWSTFFQVFLCATLGGPLAQNMYAKSMVLTSATFTVAFTNIIPALTFIIAVFFRLEKVELCNITGKAKVIGTIMGVGGAMILTFYKGQQLNIRSTHFDLLHGGQHMDGHVAVAHKISSHDNIFGSILALGYSLCIALYYICQSKLSVSYPCHYSNAFLYSMIAFVQSLVCFVPTERSWSEWKLDSRIRVFLAIFQGISLTLPLFLTMVVVRHQGPLFASTFNPLILVFVAVAGFLVLDEKLYVGSLIGSVIVITGLYLVLWGKGKETKKLSKTAPLGSSNDAHAASNTIATLTTLKTMSVAPTSFSLNIDKGDELATNYTGENHKEHEIFEEVEGSQDVEIARCLVKSKDNNTIKACQ